MGECVEMVPVGGELCHRRPARLHVARRLTVAADAILVVCSCKRTASSGRPALGRMVWTFGERGAPGA